MTPIRSAAGDDVLQYAVIEIGFKSFEQLDNKFRTKCR